jgi:hypothetical protein
MDKILADLHKSGQVSLQDASSRAIDPENFQRFLEGG